MNTFIENLLLQTKTTIPEYLANLSDTDFSRNSSLVFEEPEEVQRELLRQILRFASQTEFGERYDFASIRDIQQFRERIPILTWKDFESYSDRMVAGETDLLFPGAAKFFTLTSGTSGKEKYIPDSSMSTSIRKVILRYRLLQYIKTAPEILKGRLLPLTNAPEMSHTASGIPYGTASGLTLGQSEMDHLLAYPMCILQNRDPESRDYLLMRFAIEQEQVLSIAGNNAGRLTGLIALAEKYQREIIRDIEEGRIDGASIVDPEVEKELRKILRPNAERAGQLRRLSREEGSFTPKVYWPDLRLALFWLSSSVGYYVEDVKPLLPATTQYMDVGYGASEAKFNIPMKPDEKSGALSIATAFYEFIPEEGGEPLLAHELEDGKKYELVVTTWAGLYRYNMKDIIRVDGFAGKTPKIEFVQKSSELLNIAGEKIPASAVHDCIRDVLLSYQIQARQVQVFCDLRERRYICYVEPVNMGTIPVSEDLNEQVNKLLADRFQFYGMRIYQQQILKPLRLVWMKVGWQASLYEHKLKPGISLSQIKLPVLVHEAADKKWIADEG